MSSGQTHGGKGSTTRPTDKKKYEDNYDRIFDKKKKDKQDKDKKSDEQNTE